MAAVIGQTNPNPLPIRGKLWIDAREYGVSPQNSDNGPALQAACDAATAMVTSITSGFGSGIGPTVTVFIPAAKTPYYFHTPVYIEASNVEIKGEGTGTQLCSASAYGFPIVYLGLYRVDGSPAPNATYRPDIWNGGSTSWTRRSSRPPTRSGGCGPTGTDSSSRRRRCCPRASPRPPSRATPTTGARRRSSPSSSRAKGSRPA